PYPLSEQPLARALTDGKPVADVVYLRAGDGAIRPYTMTSLPLFDPDGELIGVGNYVTDAQAPTGPPPPGL
ncbi:MAG: fold, partial [Gaiellaceae bacterium]|nr:fold [Gaiellaceae bacterium]